MSAPFKLRHAVRRADPVVVSVVYDDHPDEQNNVVTLNQPNAGQIADIRRELGRMKDAVQKGTTDESEDIIGLRLAALCIDACIDDQHRPEGKWGVDDWLTFVMQTGGELSDMSVAALKLCGYPAFEEIAKMAKREVEQLVVNSKRVDPRAPVRH